MPARDRYHDQVKAALVKDGWVITHDPLRLQWGAKDMYIDLGAEHLLAAEKDRRRIAVEVKSFGSLSEMEDLEQAIGQYIVYHDVLSQVEPERELFLAVHEEVYIDFVRGTDRQAAPEKSSCPLDRVRSPNGGHPAMDTVEHYRRLIESILTDLARIPYAHGDIELQTIFDREKDHYVLMLVGRDGVRRVQGCLITEPAHQLAGARKFCKFLA